ncbi:MAG TPA: XRE family transcriptional regulator, partial [Hyphomicrobiaceae bacterium]|nr:XRE family transcriptional regulator [Hyphomicrobiaceae bacterium]
KQKATLVPVSAPIVYVKQNEFSSIKLGEVGADDVAFGRYRQVIGDTTAQGYAKLLDIST